MSGHPFFGHMSSGNERAVGRAQSRLAVSEQMSLPGAVRANAPTSETRVIS